MSDSNPSDSEPIPSEPEDRIFNYLCSPAGEALSIELRVALISAHCGAIALRMTEHYMEDGGDPADEALVFTGWVVKLTAQMLDYPDGLLPTADEICSTPQADAGFTISPHSPPG